MSDNAASWVVPRWVQEIKDRTSRFAWPPQLRIEPTSCRCGGTLAWMQKRSSGAWEMIGCVCHHTPPVAVGVTLEVSVGREGS